MLKERRNNVRDSLQLVLQTLAKGGLSKKLEKEKGGKLEMERREGVWKEYYFMLHKGTLYYFISSKHPPKGRISCRNKKTIIHEGDPIGTMQSNNSFTIKTPIGCFHLRAKHQSALREWIDALENSRSCNQKNSVPVTTQKILDDKEILLEDLTFPPPLVVRTLTYREGTE